MISVHTVHLLRTDPVFIPAAVSRLAPPRVASPVVE